ncbi:MAG: hypothetical protein HYS67_09670, partial [Deltaproteobacteria bacterium]|nr:hypothetical protein [Deltaproteobacteria bacterium]
MKSSAPTGASSYASTTRPATDLANYGVEERDGKAYLRAAETIEEERILGVVSAGYSLNSDFLRRLQRIAGDRVTITIGNRIYSAGGTSDRGNQLPAGTLVDKVSAQD